MRVPRTRAPTPQGGGIAVVAAALASLWLGAALAGLAGGTQLAALTLAAAILALIGAVDDIRGLGPLPRLVMQAVAVGIVIATLPADFRIVPLLPRTLESALLLLGGVWFVNLVNFMDGIDWMTVAETVPITAGVALLGLIGAVPPSAILVALALLGAIIGFAPFNRPVARLFLGDVGSLPIGLMLGWILMMLASRGHLAAALLLPLYYLADATITLARRLMRARSGVAGAPHAFLSARDRRRILGQGNRGARVRAQSRAGDARAGERDRARPARRSGDARARRRAGRLAARHLRARQAVKVLVTGASGLIGRPLTAALADCRPSGARRGATARRHFRTAVEVAQIGDLAGEIDWPPLLAGMDAVVHLAGIAHIGTDVSDETYDRVNHLATAALARAAATAAVKRFVFVSSIRAQSGTHADHPLTESDPPQPTEAYGRSKLAAEEAVRASGVPYTILRPVLVYGRGAKGNLAHLLRLARLPLPLPFGGSQTSARCSAWTT